MSTAVVDAGAGSATNPWTVIGEPPHHWLLRSGSGSGDKVMDLTRPIAPNFAQSSAGSSMQIKTTTSDIIVSPKTSALVIIDMQNTFLSPAIGHDPNSTGNKAKRVLAEVTIPAARAAGMRVIWLNWGLTDEDLAKAPPGLKRLFDHRTSPANNKVPGVVDPGDKKFPSMRGLGVDLGPVELEDGSVVDGGRLKYVGSWNAAIAPPLDKLYEEGLSASPPDVLINKNRLSGLWGARTDCSDFLEKEGITTLFFAGVETDRCVGGTLTDAFSRGYDCILLNDAAATSGPDYVNNSWIQYNGGTCYGFVTDSNELRKSAEAMRAAKS